MSKNEHFAAADSWIVPCYCYWCKLWPWRLEASWGQHETCLTSLIVDCHSGSIPHPITGSRLLSDNNTDRLPILEELDWVSKREAVVPDAVVESFPSSLSLIDLVSDPPWVQLRVLHHAISGRHELTHASFHHVGRFHELAKLLQDHLNWRQRVAVVALTHVQLTLKLVQFVL